MRQIFVHEGENMSTSTFKSAQYLAEKQLDESREAAAQNLAAQKERRMLLGYFVISLLATLFISGALKLY